MRFVNRDDFPSIAIDLMFEDIDDVGVWFCSAGREPQSSDTNGFLCTIAILVGIEVAQPNDSFFESVVAFRGVCSDALSCERSEEHTSELQSLMRISYAVFCLKKKQKTKQKKLHIMK